MRGHAYTNVTVLPVRVQMLPYTEHDRIGSFMDAQDFDFKPNNSVDEHLAYSPFSPNLSIAVLTPPIISLRLFAVDPPAFFPANLGSTLCQGTPRVSAEQPKGKRSI